MLLPHVARIARMTSLVNESLPNRGHVREGKNMRRKTCHLLFPQETRERQLLSRKMVVRIVSNRYLLERRGAEQAGRILHSRRRTTSMHLLSIKTSGNEREHKNYPPKDIYAYRMHIFGCTRGCWRVFAQHRKSPIHVGQGCAAHGHYSWTVNANNLHRCEHLSGQPLHTVNPYNVIAN